MRLVSRRRRREVADTLRSLLPLIPAPWSVDVFVRRVADQRNRPIRLVDQPLPGDITGLWIPTDQVDYVVVAERATRAAGSWRDAIIGHEIAHMVLGHDPLPVTSTAGLSVLESNVSPQLVQRFLPRHGYEARIEREAETFATRLIAHIESRTTGSAGAGGGTEHDRLCDRIR